MGRDTNVDVQVRAGQHINTGDIDSAVDLLFAVHVVDHNADPEQSQGREGLREFFHALTRAFPDVQITIHKTVADDDHVSIAYTLSGTHRGEYLGIAPTGKRVETSAMQIGRFDDDRVVERWGSMDQLSILRQLRDE